VVAVVAVVVVVAAAAAAVAAVVLVRALVVVMMVREDLSMGQAETKAEKWQLEAVLLLGCVQLQMELMLRMQPMIHCMETGGISLME
jgi:hypothetical protein